jgi:RNA polymerase sigma-70 factor (ECF subfamily)
VAVPIEEMAEDTRRGQVYVLRDRAPDPERQLIQKQKERLLRQAIVRLPRRLRRVVELRVKHGYSGRQIAEDLGISESAAKSRLLRAHLRLCSRETARVNAIRQGNVRNCGMSRV